MYLMNLMQWLLSNAGLGFITIYWHTNNHRLTDELEKQIFGQVQT